ncbi:MAG TPA: hypothetical protein VF945_01375 [Polyangia bacterium]
MATGGRALLPLSLLVVGCTQPRSTVLPYPIPLELSGAGGGLVGRATVGAGGTPFSVVVDTGTILTTFDDGSGGVRAMTGDLTLYGVDGVGNAIPRLAISDVQLFEGPLGLIGVGGAATKVGGVIGGDNLSRFAVGFDYRGAAPTMTVTETLTQCDCELAPSCDRQELCYAVLPFTLAGGQDTTLQGQTRITIGQNQYSYPPTRVLLDACLEPLPDPIPTTACVQPGGTCPGDPAYVPSGVDVKLIVASGFPGVALSANAYDRLRGAGAAAVLLGGPLTTLHLVDPADEGPIGAGVQVATTTLGRKGAGGDRGASPLALVSGKEPFFGPCASLARSRRIRRAYIAATPADADFERAHPGQCSGEHCCLLDSARPCLGAGGDYTAQCAATTNSTQCNDSSDDTPAAAVVELESPLPIYVMPDVTPLLVGINADVRPTQATVDGIVGTAALAQLVATIDYPSSRFIAQCVREDDCVAYPRLSPQTSCDFCAGPKTLKLCPDLPGMRACPPAP